MTSEQESLFVIADQVDHMQTRDFSGEGLATTNRIEQKLHLINTLGSLAGARMRAGLVHAGFATVADRYGDEASAVVLGAEHKRVELLNHADESFKQATGHYALLDAGVFPAGNVKRTTTALYSDFLKKYWLPGHQEDNLRYRRSLASEIADLATDSEREVSIFNRQHGIRPHAAQDKSGENRVGTEHDVDTGELGTRQRLEAIRFDPRAGFLPKTNSAKNRIISWLDYLDNPEKELGIIHQLSEVYVRAKNPTRKSPRPDRYLGPEYGVRAIEGIAWEVGDDLLEVDRRHKSAIRLKAVLNEGARPDLSLYDEFCRPVDNEATASLEGLFESDLLGLAAYVQYLDLEEYAQKGSVEGLISSPLMASEDPPRSMRPKFDPSPGKRKTIYTQYTGPDIKEEFRQHIIQRLKQTSIGSARHTIDDHIYDLEKEYSFMERRLVDIRGFKSSHGAPLQNAITEIQRQLAEQNAVA